MSNEPTAYPRFAFETPREFKIAVINYIAVHGGSITSYFNDLMLNDKRLALTIKNKRRK